MMNISFTCSCGGAKIVDTISDDGAVTREGISCHTMEPTEFATKVYCEICGTMYHPQSVGVDRYTTATRINPQ